MESRTKSWIGWVVAIIALVVIVVVIIFAQKDKGPAVSSDSRVITMAAVLGFTKDAAQDSEEIKKGIEMAKTDLAQKGITLNVTYEDDGTDPTKSVLAFQKILNQGKPDFVIGPTWGFVAAAVADIITENKIPNFQPANTSLDPVQDEYTYNLFGSPRIALKQDIVQKFVQDNDIETVLIITDKNIWGNQHKAAFEEGARLGGATIIGSEQVPIGQDSLTDTILAKYKDKKPDVIMWSGFEEGANILLKKYKQYGYESYILGEPLLEFRDAGVAARDIGKVFMIKTDISPEFIAKYTSAYGMEPGSYADSAYDGVMMFVDAISHVGKDPDAIMDYLKNPKYSYKGYHTTFSFDSKGDISTSTWVLKPVQ